MIDNHCLRREPLAALQFWSLAEGLTSEGLLMTSDLPTVASWGHILSCTPCLLGVPYCFFLSRDRLRH